MLKVGDELGRYEIIAHLRNGGMATLYLGRRRRPHDNRIFAIKVVHPHFLDDEDLVQMFQDEASLSLRIQHPNVVRVEEVGEASGMHYLAMEYVHGCSVAQLLQALIRRRRRMSPELAVYIAMQVCDALSAAHDLRGDHGEPLNVVHRDISPQNILLSHTGELRLIDFGIAKSRARMHHSATGSSVRGKLRYMSPEHAKGRNVDRRTDIYALGVVLWEMLTMRPLFWGETDFDVLTRVQDPVVEPPSAYAPHISPALDDAVLAALAPDREGRPGTAKELRRMLSGSVPIAEALDEEQIAELLHAVLGEEMGRVAERMPPFVMSEMRLEGAGATTLPGKRRQVMDMALEALTDPGADDAGVSVAFVAAASDSDSASIDELLSAAAVELIEDETSVSVRASSIAREVAAARSGVAVAVQRPEAEPDDRTEELSHTALLRIHAALEQLAKRKAVGRTRSSPPTAPPVLPMSDIETLDEKLKLPPISLGGIAGDGEEAIDAEPPTVEQTIPGVTPTADPEEDGTTTLKQSLDVLHGREVAIAAVRVSSPPPPPHESRSGSGGWQPAPVMTIPGGHSAPAELPQRPGQSEPPTTVWDGSEEEEGQLSAADKIALVAGVAVAAALLAGIATFLLF